jgi:hypothetical protein
MENITKVTIKEAQKLWKFSKFEKDCGFLWAETGVSDNYKDSEKHVIIYNKKFNVAYLASTKDGSYHLLMEKFSNTKNILEQFNLKHKIYDYFFKDGVIRALNNIGIRRKIKKLKEVFGWNYKFCREFLLNNFSFKEKIDESKLEITKISINYVYDYKGIVVRSVSKINSPYEVYVFSFGKGKDIFFNIEKILETRKINKFHELQEKIIDHCTDENKLNHLIYSFLYLENSKNVFSENSPKYKNLKKLLSSDKSLDDKYFLVKCFVSND